MAGTATNIGGFSPASAKARLAPTSPPQWRRRESDDTAPLFHSQANIRALPGQFNCAAHLLAGWRQARIAAMAQHLTSPFSSSVEDGARPGQQRFTRSS
jgi:hypothetical protein